MEPTVGEALCRLFPPDENIDLRRIAQIARQSLRRKEGGSSKTASSTSAAARSVTDSSSPGIAESSSSRSDMLMLGLYQVPKSASEADCSGCCYLLVHVNDDDQMTRNARTSFVPERCRTILEYCNRKSGLERNSVRTMHAACVLGSLVIAGKIVSLSVPSKLTKTENTLVLVDGIY